MYKTMEEGLSVYKQELKKYLGWLEPLKKEIAQNKNIKVSEVSSFHDFDNSEYEKSNTWNAGLVAMEQVLGLDKTEIERYLQESLSELEEKV